ncbi:protein unc-79 homolog isoform X2 [Liolophura sinensis]|uniref:protein unc-79 homolog isoform X2 n=1 Tax=Liolophura sinensis TaxID=3198878 RepID=UPI0031587C9F
MATRAATFTSKIRNLKDYHYRIINNLSPQPTGVDIANTLKYFSQTLLSVLKDVPNIPAESFGPRQRDSVRLSIFPNLNYCGLYKAVLGIIDVVPLLQFGQLALGEAVLNVLGCLVPFLEYDLLDSLPYTVAATLAIFPKSLHKDTIELLCSNLLPMTLGFDGCAEPSYASESAAAIMTLVFQHTDNGAFHTQIVETLMSMKKSLCKDILSVIAYGPPAAKAPAVHLLFYYWPQLNPLLSDRRGLHYKYLAWTPVLCQREKCLNARNCQAVKMCLNPALAIQSGDKPPPLYICSDCVDVLKRDHAEYMVDITLPMSHISPLCENKNCSATDHTAVCTCFSIECASYNGNHPIRYCRICHFSRHSTDHGMTHIFHDSIPDIWDCPSDMQRYLLDAIVSLLKEAQPIESKRMVEMGEEHRQRVMDDEDFFEAEEAEERKLLSRYGIWLMVELCNTREDIPIEVLGRLLGMLFQWFDSTAYLPDDNVGNALEKLKPEYVYKWLQRVNKTHFEVIVSCLLPHPVEYARVGGYWDTLANRTCQIKEGLNRLFCLVPYDIITFEIWDYVMPYWLEAVRTEVPSGDMGELKVLLCKAFDIDMCPLPFTLEKMYHFASERFVDQGAYVQEQALQWLQILSDVDIIIPMHILFGVFKSGVNSLTSAEVIAESMGRPLAHHSLLSPSSPIEDYVPPLSPEHTHGMCDQADMFDRETELNLPCYILMLDLILKQMELQDSPEHLGIFNETTKDIMQLVSSMLSRTWDGTHTCQEEQNSVNCLFCQNIVLWHKLASELFGRILPRDPVKIPTKELPKMDEMQKQKSHKKKNNQDGNSSPELKDDDEEVEPDFRVKEMPVHLQLFDALLKELHELEDSDAIFSLLYSLKFLCLHGECLNYTVSQYETYLKYSMSKTLVPELWKLLQSDHSHLSFVAVPLLLHCMTLPTGADVFWQVVEEEYSSDDWRQRFACVEKVTVLARHLDSDMIRCNQVIQTTLAHAFCLLIGSLEDINAAVAQKTVLYLETIKPSAIKCLCQCLEFQFDTVIADRVMILQRLRLLASTLPTQPILTWEFFLNRFDTLSLEAQLDLESNGDIQYPTDLSSSDRESEHFLRKLNRARFALARTDSIRSVSDSLKTKPPYRRTVSVPLHLVTKTASPKAASPSRIKLIEFNAKWRLLKEKDKAYMRQQSAPFNLGRRLTGKFSGGLGGFSNYMFQGGQLREFTDEESNFAALLQRAMDLEGVDRNTVYELVALLMKYMVKCNQDEVNEDRAAFKAQNIVLRHLNVLLGYNQTEKAFSVPPYKLRCSAVFNAFLAGLPHVLDKNFKLGNMILPISLLLLQYGPSPQRYASDYQPPTYTLWYLEPHTRQAWLMALLVILYKYQISSTPVSTIMQTLIRIVINTIDAQHHRCKKNEDGFAPASPAVPRNRDASKVSMSDLENIQETETPPQSPTESHGDLLSIHLRSPAKESLVQYVRSRQPEGLVEEEPSDADSSPALKLNRKPLKIPVHRTPRRLVDYSLTESEEERDDRTCKEQRAIHEADKEQSTDRETEREDDEDKDSDDSHTTAERKDSLDQVSSSTTAKTSTSSGVQRDEIVESHTTCTNLSEDSYLEDTANTPGEAAPGLHGANPSQLPASAVDHKMVQQIEEFEGEVRRSSRTQIQPLSGSEMDGMKTSSEQQADDEEGSQRKLSGEEKERKRSSEERDSLSRERIGGSEERALSSEERLLSSDQGRETMSEVEESAEDSEKTQTTSDAESDKQQATTDSGECQQDDNKELGEEDLAHQTPSSLPKPNFRQRKQRKTGLTTVELQKIFPELADTGPTQETTSSPKPSSRRSRKAEILNKPQKPKKQAPSRCSETLLVERCPECNAVLEQYDEDTVGQCIIVLATFIHREPSLATPILLETFQTVARIASHSPYSWQSDGLVVPGNCVSIARQFLRCCLHQLAPNGIFPMLFQSNIEDSSFMKTMATALVDFSELNCHAPLLFLLEGLNSKKNLPTEGIVLLLNNVSTYINCITLESNSPVWNNILIQFDIFFRRLVTVLPNPCDMTSSMKIMIAVLKVPGVANNRCILEPFSKLLSFALQNCSFKLQHLLDICSLSNRAFVKERDKLFLTRSVIFEFVQALKFKSTLPDENWLLLAQFVILDAGGTISPTPIVEDMAALYHSHANALVSTSASECMRQHLTDCTEFIADLHTLTKVKSIMKGGSSSLNEDTLGSQLKAALAQYIALEISKGNGRDSRAITRYLPWLYHPPSAMQQGTKEFIDCVGHIRLLSWLLIGSLTHTALTDGTAPVVCQPIPMEASNQIADHVMVIMTGFAEQSKASVPHMSSLFHAFILCQLWTMYCESAATMHPAGSESHITASSTIMDFWARVTPGVLQLLSHSKVEVSDGRKQVVSLAEMVNLHFLSLMEALQECNSFVLAKLFPMWTSVLYSYHSQLPGHLQVRLQTCQNWEPTRNTSSQPSTTCSMLLTWLKRIQFKLGQIEVQSSTATQFFTV